jgi:hypothetical protein
LRQEEETWRQKSRLNWLASGDRNTKFFHAYANSRKQINTIWEMSKEDGTMISSNQDLQKEAVGFFRNIFLAHPNLSITDQLAILRNYPRMFTEEDSQRLTLPVTSTEVLSILKGFKASKSHGPDGWTVEFFLAFFDILGDELVEMVEESRKKGRVSGALNATFLALIPKSENPRNFGDYRPISLCNLMYKIITKIIANIIKSSLSCGISKEQFGFLEGRQITDAIGIVQEALHSIKVKNIKAMVLKLDMIKAYDRVDWGFLRLVLLQVGMSLEATDWIMGCVTSANFVVLINGKPTKFFKSTRGLRQGCPLSPLLFLLVVEGLSRAIKEQVRDKNLEGIHVARGIYITHLMFVDDIILFGNDNFVEWNLYKDLLELFSKATGMAFSPHKSMFLEAGWTTEDLAFLKEILPFDVKSVDAGFKYLGCFLKAQLL